MDDTGKNIVLIGMPGCGKSTIGKVLSKKLGMKFIDIDIVIEKQEKCTISQLFQQGEEHFRNQEAKAVQSLENEDSSVIAAGGGVVKRASNMDSLRKNGIVIYIDRSIKDILMDIDISTRPLLAGGRERLEQLYRERCFLYRKYSDFTVTNKGKITETVENIIYMLRNMRGGINENNGHKRTQSEHAGYKREGAVRK